MDGPLWHEIVGYIASAIVVFSLSMKSVLRLRLIGLAGSIGFFAYGMLIGSVPIAITNVVIMAIHAYFLRKLLGRNEVFSILRVKPDSLYLKRFLEFHAEQIQRFQPGFEYAPTGDTMPVFVLRDMIPAGLLIAVHRDDDSLEIQLDYATPQYRDFKLGPFVYSDDSEIFGRPICAWSEPWSEEHTAYLGRMGFRPTERYGRRVLERALGG
ncbi:MAG: YgjV family protein [Acidobacteria bacterium]|nr:YgjV family protein [Acidobacteriota bacterium]